MWGGGGRMGREGSLPEASQDHRSQGWEAPPGSAVSLVSRYKTVALPRPHMEPGRASGPEEARRKQRKLGYTHTHSHPYTFTRESSHTYTHRYSHPPTSTHIYPHTYSLTHTHTVPLPAPREADSDSAPPHPTIFFLNKNDSLLIDISFF